MRSIKDTPAAAVSDGEVVEHGLFREPFRDLNVLDLDILCGNRTVPRFLRPFRLKEWEHYGIITPDYYFGMVIFNANFMGTSFFYCFDRATGDYFEHSHVFPGHRAHLAKSIWYGESFLRLRGYRMRFRNNLSSNLQVLQADIKARGKRPAVVAEITVLDDYKKYEPLVDLSPVVGNRLFYTHKTACPVEGFVSFDGKRVQLDPQTDLALMDLQKSYYPYRSFWKWATFAGHDSSGRLLAMNMCENFLEESERYNENCVWVDGRIFPCSAAVFSFNEDDPLEPWEINTTDGALQVRFKPQGLRAQRSGFGPILSDFKQPFGTFTGTVRVAGETIEVENHFGLCEHHLARY